MTTPTTSMTEEQFMKLVSKTPGIYLGEYKAKNGPYITSNTWSGGGSYGNCWNDSISTVDADAPLTEFDEFDSVIETLIPDISLFQYKRLKKEAVYTHEEHDHCYYGGRGTTSFCYRCDLKTLYQVIKDLGLLDKIK